MQTTIQARVKFLAETNPHKDVFVFVSTTGQRSTLSCQEVYELSSKVGSLLKKEGIKPGDVVCNTLPNSPETVICDFGILAAGGTILNKTAYLSDGTDLCHMLNTSKCKLVIADPTQSPNVWEILKKQIDAISKDGQVQSERLPFLQHVILAPIANGNTEFINRIQKEESFLYTESSSSDSATIWMTSGTTGLPKLILRPHECLFANARMWASILNENTDSIFFNDTAMGHASSFAYSFLASCATRVLIDHRFQLPADMATFVWEIVCSEKCSAAAIRPSVFKAILRSPELLEKKNYLLDLLCATGQPVQKNWSRVLGKMTRSFCLVYGSSEVGVCNYKSCSTSSEVLDYIVGYPAAKDIEVKVVDDNQDETTPNTPGELLIRSDYVFERYIGNEKPKEKIFTSDGWYKTDDLAFKDKDGCLYVMCRRSDAIGRGVATVYPSYFERPIQSWSAVADVVAIPVPDADLCQDICACIILCNGITADEKEVADMCDSFFIADSLIPAPKYYMLMQDFPLLASGKPDKKKLIIMAKEKFSLKE